MSNQWGKVTLEANLISLPDTMYQSVPVLAQQAQPGARESGRPLYLVEVLAKTGHGRAELFSWVLWQRNRKAESAAPGSASAGRRSTSQYGCLLPK